MYVSFKSKIENPNHTLDYKLYTTYGISYDNRTMREYQYSYCYVQLSCPTVTAITEKTRCNLFSDGRTNL